LINVLKEAASYLNKNKIENPRLNADLLLGKVLGLSRIELYLKFEQPLNKKERDEYKILLRRRVSYEPLQYILGEVEFMSLPFKVTSDVLIPRPETEVLVQKAIEEINAYYYSKEKIYAIDIGTGSGNIAVSLAVNVGNINFQAIDISSAAIIVAEENARLNNVTDHITFQVTDIMKPDFVENINREFDVIVSNPPYVTSSLYENLPKDIRDYEPKHALEAGYDGLSFYRRFAEIIPKLLKRPGLALFEIDENQTEKIKAIFSSEFKSELEIVQDLTKRDRIIIVRQK
jgi:release factor glutamine methyltransferase